MKRILAEIDAEIARLQQARGILTSTAAGPKKQVGRPRKDAAASPAKKKVKRVLSADARKRIADAQKRRWAAQKSSS